MSDAATTSSPTTATPAPASTPAAPAAAPAGRTFSPDNPFARPGVITDAAFDALPATDQGRFSRVRKGPDGGSEWQERSTLPSETAATPGQPDEQPNVALNPTETYKFGDLQLKGQEILDLLKHKGETDLRRAAVPTDPGQYRIEAKDVVLPPGMDWKFNENDPALAVARNWAHANGLTQEQFSSLLGQYASMEAAKENTFRSAMRAELDKLGANGTMRMTALSTWLNGVVGPDLAKSVVAGCFSEKQVRALEALATKFASQGHASFSQAHREPAGQPGCVSEEAYNAMSPAERWDYAKSFEQKQFRNGR
jgi:hypothetical protein